MKPGRKQAKVRSVSIKIEGTSEVLDAIGRVMASEAIAQEDRNVLARVRNAIAAAISQAPGKKPSPKVESDHPLRAGTGTSIEPATAAPVGSWSFDEESRILTVTVNGEERKLGRIADRDTAQEIAERYLRKRHE